MTNVVDSKSPSEVFFESLNRLGDAKQSGGLRENEFPKIIELLGTFSANKIKQGKMSEEELEDFNSYIECFIGPYKDNYFNRSHDSLDVSAKKVLEGNYVALQENEMRQESAAPVKSASEYNEFKKLRM